MCFLSKSSGNSLKKNEILLAAYLSDESNVRCNPNRKIWVLVFFYDSSKACGGVPAKKHRLEWPLGPEQGGSSSKFCSQTFRYQHLLKSLCGVTVRAG